MPSTPTDPTPKLPWIIRFQAPNGRISYETTLRFIVYPSQEVPGEALGIEGEPRSNANRGRKGLEVEAGQTIQGVGTAAARDTACLCPDVCLPHCNDLPQTGPSRRLSTAHKNPQVLAEGQKRRKAHGAQQDDGLQVGASARPTTPAGLLLHPTRCSFKNCVVPEESERRARTSSSSPAPVLQVPATEGMES